MNRLHWYICVVLFLWIAQGLASRNEQTHMQSLCAIHTMLGACDAKDNKTINELLQHHTKRIFTTKTCGILCEFSGNEQDLKQAMWARESIVECWALLFRQMAYTAPHVYTKFWERLYEFFQSEQRCDSRRNFLVNVAPVFRHLFLENLVVNISFCENQEVQEQMIADVIRFCSHGIMRNMSEENLISLFGCAWYCRDLARQCQFMRSGTNNCSHFVQCNSSGSSDSSKDLTFFTDPDRYIENICVRYMHEDVRTKLKEYCKVAQRRSLDYIVYDALDYAEKIKNIEVILRNHHNAYGLGPDLFRLQKEFMY